MAFNCRQALPVIPSHLLQLYLLPPNQEGAL